MKKWDFYYYIPVKCVTYELADWAGDPDKFKYKPRVEVLAKNRYNKSLALSLSYKIVYSEHSLTLGQITMLPFIPEIESRFAVNMVLEEALNLPQHTLAPAWSEKLLIPGVKSLEEKMGATVTTK